MKYGKCNALVLHTKKIKDTLYAVSLLTDKYGKINTRVRGAGKASSRFRVLTNQGIYCQITLYRSKESNAPFITDIDNIDSLVTNTSLPVQRIALSYICALYNILIEDHQKIIYFYEDTKLLLELLFSEINKNLFYFELYTLFRLGYYPDLNVCSICNKDYDSVFYDLIKTEVICHNCLKFKTNNIKFISAEIKNLINVLLQSYMKRELVDVSLFSFNTTQLNQVENFLREYIITIIGYKPKFFNLIEKFELFPKE